MAHVVPHDLCGLFSCRYDRTMLQSISDSPTESSRFLWLQIYAPTHPRCKRKPWPPSPWEAGVGCVSGPGSALAKKPERKRGKSTAACLFVLQHLQTPSCQLPRSVFSVGLIRPIVYLHFAFASLSVSRGTGPALIFGSFFSL